MTYHLTSPAFEGFVEYKFHDKHEGLVSFSCENAVFLPYQYEYILDNIPQCEGALLQMNVGSGKLTEIPPTPPTFADFWTAYAKGNTAFVGAKAKASKAWEALDLTEKLAAIKFIPPYLRHKADTNQNVAYAVTFLNQKTWEK